MDGSRSSDAGATSLRLSTLEHENGLLRKQVGELRTLAQELVAAETWDHEVYGRIPGPGWLLIDRDSWARVMAAVDGVDSWRPWGG